MLVIAEHKLACTAGNFFVSCHAIGLHQRTFYVFVLSTVFFYYGFGGLRESVQQLIVFDYIPVSGSLESRLVTQNTPVAIDYGDCSVFFLKKRCCYMLVTACICLATLQAHLPVGYKGKLEVWINLQAGEREQFVVLLKVLETWAVFHLQTLHRSQSLWWQTLQVRLINRLFILMADQIGACLQIEKHFLLF